MGEKKRTAKGCSSASSPSNLTSFILHLVTEWSASSTSVSFYSARLAASPDECATQGQRPPRKSGQPNSLAASSCPMTAVRNEGSLSGDKLISLVLFSCPHALFQLSMSVDMQLRQERLGQAWVTESSSQSTLLPEFHSPQDADSSRSGITRMHLAMWEKYVYTYLFVSAKVTVVKNRK